MATKTRKKNKPASAGIQQQQKATIKKETTVQKWMLPSILILSFIIYLPALKAGFVNWDDGDYVVENVLIRSLNNFSALITQPVQGNYHPLTMLSLAINYAISGNDAWSYHLFNVVFHLINSLLVFRLVLRLFPQNVWIAFFTSLFFGIHPMHVESVAWVSERKDVLYGLFFLLALISYTKYIDKGKKKSYYLSVIYFILSLLSKPAAIIFPGVLFLFDYLRQRSFTMRLFLEKLPYLIPAMVIAWLTLTAQNKVGATDQSGSDIFWKFLFGCYGTALYVVKLLIPIKLACFYPMPLMQNGPLSSAYYLSVLLFASMIIASIYFWRRNRIITFGIAFFLINLILVLQFYTVGSAIVAERYTYIPYIGLFIIIAWMLQSMTRSTLSKLSFMTAPVAFVFCILAYNQAGVWNSGETLWENAIANQPSFKAYDNRAVLYSKEKNWPAAKDLYTKAISLNNRDVEVLTDMGNLQMELQKPDSGFYYWNRALEINPSYVRALNNMGIWYAMHQSLDSAYYFLNKAISININFSDAYKNRGFVLIDKKMYKEGITDLQRFQEIGVVIPDVYNYLGTAYRGLNDFPRSLEYINKALEMEERNYFYLNRSMTYKSMNDLESARRDATTAKNKGYTDPAYLKSIGL